MAWDCQMDSVLCCFWIAWFFIILWLLYWVDSSPNPVTTTDLRTSKCNKYVYLPPRASTYITFEFLDNQGRFKEIIGLQFMFFLGEIPHLLRVTERATESMNHTSKK